MQFIYYKKCSTCIKARKYLQAMGVEFMERDILEKVSVEELKEWVNLSNKSIDKFFNTSGLVYRNGNYKEQLKKMSEEEKLKDLAENPMLIKRPLLVGNNFVLVGFNEKNYQIIGEKYGCKK